MFTIVRNYLSQRELIGMFEATLDGERLSTRWPWEVVKRTSSTLTIAFGEKKDRACLVKARTNFLTVTWYDDHGELMENGTTAFYVNDIPLHVCRVIDIGSHVAPLPQMKPELALALFART